MEKCLGIDLGLYKLAVCVVQEGRVIYHSPLPRLCGREGQLKMIVPFLEKVPEVHKVVCEEPYFLEGRTMISSFTTLVEVFTIIEEFFWRRQIKFMSAQANNIRKALNLPVKKERAHTIIRKQYEVDKLNTDELDAFICAIYGSAQ